MGHQTVAVFLNDSLGHCQDDSKIINTIEEASHEARRSIENKQRMKSKIRCDRYPHFKNSADFNAKPDAENSRCLSASAGTVIASQHADVTQVIVAGGNTAYSLNNLYNVDMNDPEAVLKALANEMGYDLVKKND